MLYDIYSVRDQGWERSLVVACPADSGAPWGDFVEWLGSMEVFVHYSPVAGSACAGFVLYGLNIVQREFKKIYPDIHPLGKGTIARKVREKIYPPDLSRPRSWKYWAQRTADAVLAEMKRRGLDTRRPLNRERFEEAMLELWRI